jgi:PhnB protein
MRLTTYLNFPGNCEQAFRFYEQHLGGTITFLQRHGESPERGPNQMPPDWKDKVLHARMDLGGTSLLGADVPQAQPMRSAYLTLHVDTAEEADRIYALLVEHGEVFMPIAETFFAYRFAMFRDRFGTSWMLLCQKPTPPS